MRGHTGLSAKAGDYASTAQREIRNIENRNADRGYGSSRRCGEIGEAEKTEEHAGFAGLFRINKAGLFEDREDCAVGIAFEMAADAEEVLQAMPVTAIGA